MKNYLVIILSKDWYILYNAHYIVQAKNIKSAWNKAYKKYIKENYSDWSKSLIKRIGIEERLLENSIIEEIKI